MRLREDDVQGPEDIKQNPRRLVPVPLDRLSFRPDIESVNMLQKRTPARDVCSEKQTIPKQKSGPLVLSATAKLSINAKM